MAFLLFLQKKEKAVSETWHNCIPVEDKCPQKRVGSVKCICSGEENAGHFREIDREWGDIFRVAKAICVCYNMHQTRM
jgi:hypothetical protein